jgi:pimeloyl-ACP methyl ester carboxylesterase
MTDRPPGATATPTFVLVPGAGGDAWSWHRLVAELEARGHGAVAVDLPATDDDAGLDAYAATVVAAIGDRRPVVLVAQSMAGLVVPLVCARAEVALVVLVNAMIPVPGETGGAWWTATGHAEAFAELAAAQGRSTTDDLDPREVFLHDLPPEALAAALERGPVDQSARPFDDVSPGWPDVATHAVAGRDDRFFPVAFQRRVARQRLGLDPEVVPGGHLLALANPTGLADALVTAWQRASSTPESPDRTSGGPAVR